MIITFLNKKIKFYNFEANILEGFDNQNKPIIYVVFVNIRHEISKLLHHVYLVL